MIEKLHDNLLTLTLSVISVISGGIAWVVRRMLTDSRRIDLLEQRQELQNHAIVAAVATLGERFERVAQSNDIAAQNQAKIVEMLAKLSEGDRP